MADIKATWQTYALTIATTLVLTLSGACYTQSNADSKQNERIAVLETTLQALREDLKEIKYALGIGTPTRR